jgi:hypothetical protein
MKKPVQKIISGTLSFFVGREKLIQLLSRKLELSLLGFKTEGYLYDIGWIRSIVSEEVVDKEGKPLPWLTYPAISFFEERLNKKLKIFEFGSGNSTFYYAGKTDCVCSVEHDKSWFDKLTHTLPGNVELFFCPLEPGGEYCNYASKAGRQFDMIFVDGRDRVNCCKNSIASLHQQGVIVLDDSERERYRDAFSFLRDIGFKKIDFWGMAPMVNYIKCTTIFYRDNNCLGI